CGRTPPDHPRSTTFDNSSKNRAPGVDCDSAFGGEPLAEGTSRRGVIDRRGDEPPLGGEGMVVRGGGEATAQPEEDHAPGRDGEVVDGAEPLEEIRSELEHCASL